ncbi:hypothetical protein DFJ73DRAFT_57936 [Zopfochytrium polystomum]|nr:hypothetical protein DFJ73DRAFT_57936 [Zopfochytrium polystomum]
MSDLARLAWGRRRAASLSAGVRTGKRQPQDHNHRRGRTKLCSTLHLSHPPPTMQQQQLPRNHHCCPHQQPQHDYHHHHHQHHQYYHQRPPVRFDQPYLARRDDPTLGSQLFTWQRHLTQGLHSDASRHHPYLSISALPTGHSRSACHLQFPVRLLQQSQPRQVSYSSRELPFPRHAPPPSQRPSDSESTHAEPKFVTGPREQEGICPPKDQSTHPNGGSFPTPRYGQDLSSNDTAPPPTSHTPKPNHSPPPPSLVTTSFYNNPPPDQKQPPSKPKGPPKCPHGKRRAQCPSCYDLGQGGGSICLHRRRRDLCPFCRDEILHGRVPPCEGRPKTPIRGPKTYVPRPPPPPPMPVLGGRGRRRTCVAAEVAVTEAGGVPAPPGTVVETEKMVQTRCSNQFSVENANWA